MEKNFDKIIKQLDNLPDNDKLDTEVKEGAKNWLNFLRTDPNNLSYWFERVMGVEKYGIKLPDTILIKLPESLFDKFFLDKKGDYEEIEEWVEHCIMPLARTITHYPIFIKNGCFSNKFRFGNNCLVRECDLKEITKHICNIQYDSLMMDTGGNLEIAIRELIEPEEGTECIYNGMPLRPEMRLFYDFDEHKYLYDVNYWDWDCCHDVICGNPQDKEVYERQYPIIKEKLEYRRDMLLPTITKALDSVTDLKGRWSIDFILDDKCAWLIDMAVAHRSAYWDESKIK